MSFSSLEVCEQTGCTYRQLDYWTRQGWLIAEVDAKGSGSQRAYSEVTVKIVKHAVALISAGLTPETALRGATIIAETGHPAISENRLVTVWAPRA